MPDKKRLKISKVAIVIRIRKSKKDKQHNGQKKQDKRTNNYQLWPMILNMISKLLNWIVHPEGIYLEICYSYSIND